jgi:outer membrane protein OmpA-like peptidoglycan-associated protein
MKNLFILIIVFIGTGFNVFAQKKSSEELKGDKYSFSYSFDKAIDSYTHAKQLSLDGQRSLAEAYHKIDQNIQSEEVYLKLIREPKGILPEDYYNYAMVLKTNGKYVEAGKWMDKFIELKPNDLRAKDYAANKNELTDLLKDAGKYKIEHLKVNTDALDFGASYYKNKVVFASSRVTPGSSVKKYTWTRKPFWDMYVSEVDGSQLKTPEIFDIGLNGKMHDGPASFSNDGTFMAFTRNNYHDRSKDRVVELQIYFSSYIDGKWSTPVPFVYNNEKYSVGQPCLTSDGKTMYFTSDMPGGYGKADIYKVTKDGKGEWGRPENMGNKINTEGYEMFPFFEENNETLFFASDGRFGLGGLDIFSCVIIGSVVDRVYNAGFPLNTQYNDYAAIVNDNMSNGYFSSDRTGGTGGDDIYSVQMAEPDVLFTVNSPTNIPVARRVREIFPVRNYVFFDLGSTEIPDRYVLITKDQVKNFGEDRLEVFTPKYLSGRSDRQMTVYYNVINILGDRMIRNPTAIVRLAGASMEGIPDGLAMAESVKKYLVNVFGIAASRINTEGRIKPRIPSEQPGGILELDLLREGDRRVSIMSETPGILMEYQTGPDAPLAPLEIIGVQQAPLDSYVTFNVDGATEAFSSWSLELRDEKGIIQKFGPYTQETVSIPGKSILGTRPAGDFNVTMIGQTKSRKTLKKEAPVHIVLWTPPENEEMLRFSVIFEFNDSQAINIYDKFLTDVVTPKIPNGGTVIIHGHTDIIGEEAHNLELSLARANEVKGIIEKALTNAGRNDVKFEVYGFGEDMTLAPFENKFAEGRFYNRTVIIDIIPPKK